MKTVALLTFIVTLLLVTTTYLLLGSSGGFYYDDFLPLGALTNVTDLNSALVYIFSNTSGPTGRPLSMASFLLNIGDWPNNGAAFFHVNILIHSANALLVFICTAFALKLFILTTHENEKDNTRIFWVASLASVFWFVLPIHAATTLIAIQRMTLLASFFTLVGIASYLYISCLITQRAKHSQFHLLNTLLIVQFACLAVFTLLATFSKENGALLPLFIFVIEVTLLRNVTALANHRRIRIFLLSISLFLLVSFILYRFLNGPTIEIGRNYTTLNRALSEPAILLTYLKLAFLPQVDAINPFHDNAKIYTSMFQWQVYIPLTIITIALVWSVLKRKVYPVISFGVLWFLVAHLLESTLIPLEPMFLHRNYLALIGPCFTIVYILSLIPSKQRASAALGGGIYLTFLLLLTFYTVSLWGTPRMAADAWYKQQKGSERATGHYIQALIKNSESTTTLKVIKEHLENCDNCIDGELKAIALACMNGEQKMASQYLQRSMTIVETREFAPVAPVALPLLFDMAANKACLPIEMQTLQKLNGALLVHPQLKPAFKRTLNENLYNIAVYLGDLKLAQQHISAAWQVSHSHKVAESYIDVMIEQGKLTEALNFASNEMCATLANRPFLKESALARCHTQQERIESAIELSEKE